MQTKLAIDGGEKAFNVSPIRKLFGMEEKKAVMDLFDKEMVEGVNVMGYNGPEEENYCKEFCEFLGGGFADGVNSGTNAVYVALRALELKPGSEVIIPAVSDPGGVMPVTICGLKPVIADTCKDYYTISAETIKPKITDKTGAIIVAHIAGTPADMEPIMQLAAKHNLPVIEDCAQIHGAKYKGRPVGTLGTISSFSLMFGKHHATGGQGGLVFTKDESLYWKVRRYADRGKPFGAKEPTNGNVVPAINCNMDELHACIGRVQLKKLPEINRRRRKLAERIAAGCTANLKGIRLHQPAADCEGVYWFLFFDFDASRYNFDKKRFVECLAAEGVPAGGSYAVVPMRMQWATELYGQCDPLPNLDDVDAKHFRCMFHEDWTESDADKLVASMIKVEKALAKK